MAEINEGASKIRSFSLFVVVCLWQLILNHSKKATSPQPFSGFNRVSGSVIQRGPTQTKRNLMG